MIKKVFFLLVIFIGFLLSSTAVFAVDPPCAPDDKRVECVFGTISPPPALQPLLKKDPTGTGVISMFLSNFVTLIFSIAAVVLLFMVLWGAFDWMVSEGDKEKVASARSKILNAMIGLILFAIAFAVARLLGQFTGFSFFAGQNDKPCSVTCGTPVCTKCPPGSQFSILCDTTDASQCRPR